MWTAHVFDDWMWIPIRIKPGTFGRGAWTYQTRDIAIEAVNKYRAKWPGLHLRLRITR